ncbi:MAG: hypothetical protein ACLFS2_12060, partial [Halochromatium sp.]
TDADARGDDEASNNGPASEETAGPKDRKTSSLAAEDYQIFEALNVLKGLVILGQTPAAEANAVNTSDLPD